MIMSPVKWSFFVELDSPVSTFSIFDISLNGITISGLESILWAEIPFQYM